MKQPKAPTRGRPELPPEDRKDHTIRVRVTQAEAKKFDRLGGADWLRGQIKRARVPDTKDSK